MNAREQQQIEGATESLPQRECRHWEHSVCESLPGSSLDGQTVGNDRVRLRREAGAAAGEQQGLRHRGDHLELRVHHRLDRRAIRCRARTGRQPPRHGL